MNFPDHPPPQPAHLLVYTTNNTKLFAIVFLFRTTTWIRNTTSDSSYGETADDCPPPIWDSTLWSVINLLDTKSTKSSDVITAADDCWRHTTICHRQHRHWWLDVPWKYSVQFQNYSGLGPWFKLWIFVTCISIKLDVRLNNLTKNWITRSWVFLTSVMINR